MSLTLPPPPALADASHRLGLIVGLLRRGIGAWAGRDRAAGGLALLAYTRTGRLMLRLQALLALLATGRLPRSRVGQRGPRAATPPPRPPSETDAPPRPVSLRLPRRVGWLMPYDLDIRGASRQLRHWLTDPAVIAVLAEVPQARRPLAALCRMLAIPPWPLPPDGPLPPSKPRVRKPRPRKPRRPTLAEDRAAVWHHRCIETDSGLVRPGKRPWWMPARRPR